MAKFNLYKQIKIVTYTLWLLFWFVFQALAIHYMNVDWQFAVVDALLSVTLMALGGYVIMNTYRFYTPGSANYLYRLFYVVLLSSIYLWLLKLMLGYIYAGQYEYLNFLNSSMLVRSMFSFLMMACIALLSGLQYYMEEQKKTKKRRDEAEQLLREAELAKLRQQLQPHFLFNSLNSISALVSSQPERARKMIEQLSDFLRGTLKKDERKLLPLSEELQYLQLYMDIEKVRFGHRLNTEIIVDENSLQMKLPSFILQPVLENAIKFGLYGTTDKITIKLTTHTATSLLTIKVENPFDTETSKPNTGTGFGLNSIRKRLYLLYGRNDLLVTEQTSNTFITTLLIPQ